mgnify:CR=1 FL=1
MARVKILKNIKRAASSSNAGLVALVGGQHESVIEIGRVTYCPHHKVAIREGTKCDQCRAILKA